MGEVLLKAATFIFMIILGYVLKKVGLFSRNDHLVISKILLNVTLPAAVISSFGEFDMNASLLILILLGLTCNVVLMTIGYLVSRKKDRDTIIFSMINYPSYNIGLFTLPYVQGFFGSSGVVMTCMFDIGNALITTGGSYAITSAVIGEQRGGRMKAILRKLSTSVPFLCYVVMLLIAVFNVKIPEIVLTFIRPIGGCNGFLAMFMIGMMFEVSRNPKYLKRAGMTLVIRYLVSAVFFVLFYFVLPFSDEMRKVLAILSFAPIGSLSPIFTEKCGGDGSLASFTGSVSILISIVVMTTLMLVLP